MREREGMETDFRSPPGQSSISSLRNLARPMDAGSVKVSQLILAHHHHLTILHPPATNVERRERWKRNENRKSTMKPQSEYTIVWLECHSRKCTYAPVYSFFFDETYCWAEMITPDANQAARQATTSQSWIPKETRLFFIWLRRSEESKTTPKRTLITAQKVLVHFRTDRFNLFYFDLRFHNILYISLSLRLVLLMV